MPNVSVERFALAGCVIRPPKKTSSSETDILWETADVFIGAGASAIPQTDDDTVDTVLEDILSEGTGGSSKRSLDTPLLVETDDPRAVPAKGDAPPKFEGTLFPARQMVLIFGWMIIICILEIIDQVVSIASVSGVNALMNGIWSRTVVTILIWRTLPNLGNARPVYEYRSFVSTLSAWIVGGLSILLLTLQLVFTWDILTLRPDILGKLSYLVTGNMTLSGLATYALVMWEPTIRGGWWSVGVVSFVTVCVHRIFLDATSAVIAGSFACLVTTWAMIIVFTTNSGIAKGFRYLVMCLIPWYFVIFVYTVVKGIQSGTLVSITDNVNDNYPKVAVDSLAFRLDVSVKIIRILGDTALTGYILMWIAAVRKLAWLSSSNAQTRYGRLFHANVVRGSSQYLPVLERTYRTMWTVFVFMFAYNCLSVCGIIGFYWNAFFIDLLSSLLSGWIQIALYSFLLNGESPSWRSCREFALAQQFMRELNVDQVYFDEAHNKCLCRNSRCLPPGFLRQVEHGLCYWRGSPIPRKFSLPIGWQRLGLQFDTTKARNLRIFEDWNVCFHGTTPAVLESILRHQELLLPGDTLIDGTQLSIRENHVPGQVYVYTSPTIAYAGTAFYATPVVWRGRWVRVVLECRQYPQSVHEQAETIEFASKFPGKSIDPAFDNGKIEWFTNRRVAVVLTGVLVHIGEPVSGNVQPPSPRHPTDVNTLRL